MSDENLRELHIMTTLGDEATEQAVRVANRALRMYNMNVLLNDPSDQTVIALFTDILPRVLRRVEEALRTMWPVGARDIYAVVFGGPDPQQIYSDGSREPFRV